ncbi:MAG TPA: hypothetical protein VKQ32_06570 [Polyangia bacterium]|nr:hypothetical protein [Polyangia bacterium]
MRTAIGAVISVLVVSGCGGGLGGYDGGTGGSGGACVPGMSVSCACTTGLHGAQVCTADGAGYGPCACTGQAGAGGSVGAGGAAGTGGTGGTICDAPHQVFQSTDTQRGCGSDNGCHGAVLHESGLDLVSPGVIARLLDKAPDPTTSISCMGSTMPYLIPNSNPASGLLIDKLKSSPSCGVAQPYPLGNLPADQKSCLLQWATAVTTGVITQ